MRRTHRGKGSDTSLETLRAELEEGLAGDPRMLLDPTFLRALHGELRERLGADAAEAMLLRAGFFHGLRDALLAMHAGGSQPAASPLPTPLLAMSLSRPKASGDDFALSGRWSEPVEARAVREAGIAAQEPVCFLSTGYTSGWLSGVWERDVLVLEASCVASGAAACRFAAREAETWRSSGDARAQRLLEALPFDALWAVASRAVEDRSEAAGAAAIDPESPAIHVWGPVMVVPYAGAETAVAVESIVRDPGARQVSVVVIDLAGILLDEGFGAVSLERALDAIETWGAETILTGVSPLSERVVAELERTHVVLRKDLSEAIAAAFQIAQSQRNPA